MVDVESLRNAPVAVLGGGAVKKYAFATLIPSLRKA